MSTHTETAVTTQVYRVYIKASPEAIWDAITDPEWTKKYGYHGLNEYELYTLVQGPDKKWQIERQALVETDAVHKWFPADVLGACQARDAAWHYAIRTADFARRVASTV